MWHTGVLTGFGSASPTGLQAPGGQEAPYMTASCERLLILITTPNTEEAFSTSSLTE